MIIVNVKSCYPVHYEDALQFVPESELFGRYGDRIKEAKSHGLLSFSMMARRSNDGETVLNLAHGSCNIMLFVHHHHPSQEMLFPSINCNTFEG